MTTSKLMQDAIDRAIASDPTGAAFVAAKVNAFARPDPSYRCPCCLIPVKEQGICERCELETALDVINNVTAILKESNDEAERKGE